MNDNELIDEIVKRAEEHQKQREIKFALVQLDVLKNSIDKIVYKNCFYEDGDCCQFYLAIDILNKQISKLREELINEV